MRISDWSSDVCSSDLPEDQLEGRPCRPFFYAARLTWPFVPAPCPDPISVATSIVSANWTPTRLPCDQRAVAPSRIPPPNSRVSAAPGGTFPSPSITAPPAAMLSTIASLRQYEERQVRKADART